MKKNGFDVGGLFEVEVPTQVLPDPDEISYYKLEQDRKIYLDSEVGGDTIPIQRMILRWNMEDKGKPVEERKPIFLYIFSYGGEIDTMWTMIDTILMSKTPVYTVNLGVAHSAAALIFMSGHKRYMFPNSDIVVHEGSAQMDGDAQKVIDNVNAYKLQLKRMKEFIASRTKIPPATLNKKRANDWHIDPKFCLENGVCDQIVESLDDIL